VFVHVALVGEVPSRLAAVLPSAPPPPSVSPPSAPPPSASPPAAAASAAPPPFAPTTAAFYSISSPFSGLRGVPVGGLLIKQAAASLAAAEPSLRTFVTLSPVPGFRTWLTARLARQRASGGGGEDLSGEGAALNGLLQALSAAGLDETAPFSELGPLHGPISTGGVQSPEQERADAVRRSLVGLCARYLCRATQRQRALDPVAGFHMRNGAALIAIHWAANPSSYGLEESASIMVNYHYDMPEVEARHSAYVAKGVTELAASPEVWRLAHASGSLT